jgi:hypothetical protein
MKFELNTELTPGQRKIFANRLLKLRDYLKTLKGKQYDHSSLVTYKNGHPCKTVACAFGHAVASKLFRELPLKIVQGKHFPEDFYIHDKEVDGEADVEEWANTFFGPNSWDNIFDDCDAEYGVPSKDVTRKMVVKRIEEFVKGSYGCNSFHGLKFLNNA